MMKGEAIDREEDVNKIFKSCQPLNSKTGLTTSDKGTCLIRKGKARKEREKIHPTDGSMNVSNPSRTLKTLSGCHELKAKQGEHVTV